MNEGLTVEIGDLSLGNPTILAAGILGLTGASLKRVWEAGAGAVMSKTVGREAREGYPGPRIFETSCGLLNSMGLPNPGVEDIVGEIEIAKESGAVVLGSIFGEDEEEFSFLTSEMERVNVDAVELNLSCPHAAELSLIGTDPDLTQDVVRACKATGATVWVKLPGNTNLPNIVEVAKSAEAAGADALVLINTLPAMSIDVVARRPVLGHKTGGLSGPAIKPVALRLVYEVYEEVDIPIVGTGGITNGEDMIEYILAGASAVEIGTGILYHDLEIFEKVCSESLDILKGSNIKKLVGEAHKS